MAAYRDNTPLNAKLAAMLALQLIITGYLNLGPYVSVNMLPVLILALPANLGTAAVMGISFLGGLTVDALAEGIWGLNAFACVMTGFLRNFLVSGIIDSEITKRGVSISLKRHSTGKIILVYAILSLVFFAAYNIIDLVGHREWTFIALRVLLSWAVSFALALIAMTSLFNTEK